MSSKRDVKWRFDPVIQMQFLKVKQLNFALS